MCYDATTTPFSTDTNAQTIARRVYTQVFLVQKKTTKTKTCVWGFSMLLTHTDTQKEASLCRGFCVIAGDSTRNLCAQSSCKTHTKQFLVYNQCRVLQKSGKVIRMGVYRGRMVGG